MVICPSCASENPTDNHICGQCGGSLVLACPHCQAENPANSSYCGRCGVRLKFAPLTSPPDAGSASEARRVCSGCRTVNESSAAYCYRCGLRLPDRLYPEAEVVGSPAGFWVRAAAYILDNILVTVAAIPLTAAFTGVEVSEAFRQLIGESEGWTAVLIAEGLGIAYFTFAIGHWGQTIGKAMLGLKVVREDGSRLTYWRSFARYWAYFVSALPLGLGFISIALSSQKRGWHDFLCGTRVVNPRK